MSFLVDLICGILGAALLTVVYYGFEFQWPGTYRNLADTFGLRITERLWRLVSFRAGPVFLTSILIWSISNRLAGTGWLAVTLTVVLHVAGSNGRAFIKSFIPGRPEAVINYGSYHLAAGSIAIAAGVGGSLIAPFAQNYVPSRQSFVDGFWTALLVATAAGFVLRVVGTDAPDRDPGSTDYLTTRAQRDASIDSFDMIFSTASAANADPLLVKAFAIAEILQRPSWFRRGERAFGKLRGRGTYGIMQIAADRPISDRASVQIFSETIAGQVFFDLLEGSFATAASNRVWGVSGRHNGDRNFYNAVERLYDSFLYQITWVHPGSEGISETETQPEHQTGPDTAREKIGILELRRYATEWGVRIIADCEKVEVTSDQLGQIESLTRPVELGASTWWTAEVRCPIEVDKIQVFKTGRTTAPIVPLLVRE